VPLRNKIRVGIAGTSNPKIRGRLVYPDLAQALEREGFEISEGREIDIFINVNHNPTSLRELKHSSNAKKIKKILLRLEPHAVFPSQYSSKVESIYDLILTPGSTEGVNKNNFLPFPYTYQMNPANPRDYSPKLSEVIEKNLVEKVYEYDTWKNREIHCSMIAANKISPNGSGNYAIRREYAKYANLENLSVYGQMWQIAFLSKLRYRLAVLKFALFNGGHFSLPQIFVDFWIKFDDVEGEVDDKHKIIESSKFSLVIENTNTYVSEKVLDALIGGSIPIYYGPSLELTGIPPELVISAGEYNTIKVRSLAEINEDQIMKMLSMTRDFITSDAFLKWDSENVLKAISNRVVALIRSDN
jgi:hypothetical protein